MTIKTAAIGTLVNFVWVTVGLNGYTSAKKKGVELPAAS